MRGFESYTNFKNNIKDSRQIYDITYDLYQKEVIRLEPELEKYANKNVTFRTSVNSIEHSHKALHDRLISLYPYKLRQLLLISTITSLEVFLTDVILEIFERDIKPFKLNEPVTYHKNYLLNLSSIESLKEDIIKKDFRNLTSGGLSQIAKYYKKIFSIDFRNIGISFNKIEEIHTRRHLFVHRNGFVDISYIKEYPDSGFKVGSQIKLSHEYLIYALEKISEFARIVNKELLIKFPNIGRLPKHFKGDKFFDSQLKNLMLEINILENEFSAVDFFYSFNKADKNLSDFIVKIVTYDNKCLLFISGKQSDLSPFFNSVKKSKSISLNKVISL